MGRSQSSDDAAGPVHSRLYNAGMKKREQGMQVIEQQYARSRVAKDRRGDFDLSEDMDGAELDGAVGRGGACWGGWMLSACACRGRGGGD